MENKAAASEKSHTDLFNKGQHVCEKSNTSNRSYLGLKWKTTEFTLGVGAGSRVCTIAVRDKHSDNSKLKLNGRMRAHVT